MDNTDIIYNYEYDTLQQMDVDCAQLLHINIEKNKNHETVRMEYHTFDAERPDKFLDYVLSTCDLDIFSANEVGFIFNNLWISSEQYHLLNWHNGDLYDINQGIWLEPRKAGEKYLVFRCPCLNNIGNSNNIVNSSNNSTRCTGAIVAMDFLNMYVSKKHNKKEYDRLYNKIKSLENEVQYTIYKKIIYCPNKKCIGAGGILLEKQVSEYNEFKCIHCKTEFCVKCGHNPYHKNMTCEQVANLAKHGMDNIDKDTLKYIIKNVVMCPKCKHGVQKIEGCDHMTCSRCKHGFCWVCLTPCTGIGEHVIQYDEIDAYVCKDTIKNNNRADILRKNKKETIRQIIGYMLSNEELNELLREMDDVVGDHKQTDYNKIMERRNYKPSYNYDSDSD